MKHLTDKELLKQTEILVKKERELLIEVLAHLREISDRKLFSELGYKSLFDFAVKHLGYAEGQAYRRINAMKLVRQLPGLEEKIQSGEVNLSHIGIAQNLFQQEAKAAKPYSTEQKQEVFSKIAGTSTRDAEKITLQLSSKPESLVPEKVKTISDTSVSLQITVSNSTMEKIETLRGWLAHKHPGMSTSDLLEKLCELGLKEWDPSKLTTRYQKALKTYELNQAPINAEREPKNQQASLQRNHSNDSLNFSTQEKTITPSSRPPEVSIQTKDTIPKESQHTISTSVRRFVFARAQNRCEKCWSVYFLEIDHRFPIALGGTNDPENLRVLCRNCNQRAAINAFGKDKVLSNHNKENFFSPF